jgi:hypothetical protein
VLHVGGWYTTSEDDFQSLTTVLLFAWGAKVLAGKIYPKHKTEV